MRRRRFNDERIIEILKQQQSGRSIADVCRKNGICRATFYKWKTKFGGMSVEDARRLSQLEIENAKLRRVVAYFRTR